MPHTDDHGVPFLIRKLHATVGPEILPHVMIFTGASVLTTVLPMKLGWEYSVNTIMLTVLSTVLSFAVALRVTSSLERFNEGRHAWSAMTLAARNLGFLVWLHTPPTCLTFDELSEGMSQERSDLEKVKALMEKKTIINLIQAFAVASKHYVRGEGGVYYEDLYHLVAMLPKYSFPSNVAEDDRAAILGLWRQPNANGSSALPYHPSDPRFTRKDDWHSETSTRVSTAEIEKPPLLPVRSTHALHPSFYPPRKTIYQWFPPLRFIRPLVRNFSKNPRTRLNAAKGKRNHRANVGGNVPLELALFISNYLAALMARKTLADPLVPVFFGSVKGLTDSFETLERVLTTPLPFVYQAHLRYSVYLYLLLLPFQLYSSMGYVAIAATCVCSSIFLGFLEVATQLENPFGYDDSDLDLDHFCALIGAELREVMAHPQPDPSSFVFSPLNQPFLPVDTRNAQEIVDQVQPAEALKGGGSEAHAGGVPGLRRLIAKHFHDTEALGTIERETEAWSQKMKTGTGKQVDVFLV